MHIRRQKWVHILRNQVGFLTLTPCWVHMLRNLMRAAFFCLLLISYFIIMKVALMIIKQND